MDQPEVLKTEEHVDWAWGKGQLVWGILNAAHTGDLAGVKRLVEIDASLLRCAWQYQTPMHMAAQEGRLHIVRYLFEKGADAVDLWRSGHINALQLAEDCGHQDV